MEISMRTRILTLAIVAIGLSAGLFINRPARAVPTLSVEPQTFDIAVPPGRGLSTKIKISGISRSFLPGRLTVSPTLAPYVASIEPSVLPALPPSYVAGSTTNVKIVFAVATGTPPGVIDGGLLLNGKSILPMKLTIGELLYPPDPGEAGKETLEGIDSDGDGIRDDIQRYIEITYSDQPTARAGLRQMAQNHQAALLAANDRTASREIADEVSHSYECLEALGFGRFLGARLRAEVLNTTTRSRAYISYNQNLGGMVTEIPIIPSKNACKF